VVAGDIGNIAHAFLAAFGALLDGLSATLTALGLGNLTSDDVAPQLLFAIPLSALAVIVSATIWRNAVWTGISVPGYAHVVIVLGAVGILQFGFWLAGELSLYAALNASPDDFYRTPSEVALSIMAGWPLGWAFVAFISRAVISGMVKDSVIDDGRHIRRFQSILGGLALGYLGSLAIWPLQAYLSVATTSVDQSCCPRDYTFPARHGGQLDVVIMLGYASVGILFVGAALYGADRVGRRLVPAARVRVGRRFYVVMAAVVVAIGITWAAFVLTQHVMIPYNVPSQPTPSPGL
jgi:hypothetical protein